MRYKDYKKEEKKRLARERKIEKVKVTSLVTYSIVWVISLIITTLWMSSPNRSATQLYFYGAAAVTAVIMLALGYRNAYHLGMESVRFLPIKYGLGCSLVILASGFMLYRIAIFENWLETLGNIILGVAWGVPAFIGVLLGSVVRVMFNRD